jgi:hypothetical protein
MKRDKIINLCSAKTRFDFMVAKANRARGLELLDKLDRGDI